jgi:hypothetical protein
MYLVLALVNVFVAIRSILFIKEIRNRTKTTETNFIKKNWKNFEMQKGKFYE